MNYNRRIRGKRPLKSAITAWNRSRPRNIRSIQAKRHIGRGLFCTSKPPKAEDQDNECTHHQRAHVKNVKTFLFKDDNISKFSLLHSMYDKAYVRPGTSEGCEKTRKIKILNLVDEGAKQLPKYDWPEKLVYQTPSAHRVMTKRSAEIGSDVTTLADSDTHFVVMRPKAIIDSSGTTWASEIVRLRSEFPDMFEIPPDKENVYDALHREFASRIQYATFQYLDMTEENDLIKVSSNENCPHREYECKRLSHLLKVVREAKSSIGDLERYAGFNVLKYLKIP